MFIYMCEVTRKPPADEPLLVTAAVVVKGGAVLLTKRPLDKRHPGLWEFPGGKIDPGESPEAALSRELMEELGVEVRVDEIFEVVYYRYDWGPVLILAYTCTLLAGSPRNLGVAEHRWVALSELTNYQILPADKSIIARLAS